MNLDNSFVLIHYRENKFQYLLQNNIGVVSVDGRPNFTLRLQRSANILHYLLNTLPILHIDFYRKKERQKEDF